MTVTEYLAFDIKLVSSDQKLLDNDFKAHEANLLMVFQLVKKLDKRDSH